MKTVNFLFFVLSLCSIVACSSEAETKTEKSTSIVEKADPKVQSEPVVFDFKIDTLKGKYVGKFDDNYIDIHITYINQKHALGYNIHKGLQRNLNGTVTQDADSVYLELNEPGDHEFDGVFYLAINKANFGTQGTWTPLQAKLKSKRLILKKKIEKKRLDSDNSIDEDNFAEYFGIAYIENGSGEFEFDEDGTVMYIQTAISPNNPDLEILEKVKGNWIFTGKKSLEISWQKNNILAERVMKFTLRTPKNDEDYELYLKGKTMTIRPEYY